MGKLLDSVKKTVLPNGIRVVSQTIPSVRSLSIGVWVDHGSRDEAQEHSGASHFIEHMIFKGTEGRSALDIAKAFDRMGGMSNAFTSKEMVCFHAKVLDTHEDQVLELLSDIFLNSSFAQNEVDRERLVVLQEISMVEDSPEELIHDAFYEHFWPAHGLGRSVLGTPDAVLRFQGKDLMQYLRTNFTPDRLVIAGAGNVKHQEFVEKVEAFFGKCEGKGSLSKRTRPCANQGVRWIEKPLEQASVLIGFEAPSNRDEERFPVFLFNVILGGSMSSRLFQEIRERRGLAYSVYSFHTGYSDTGLLGMYAGVQPEKAWQVTELMMKELERLAHEEVSEEELLQAKEHVKGGIILSSESVDSRMSRIAKLELTFGRYIALEELVEKIDALTPKDLLAMGQRIFNAPKAAVVLGKIPPSHVNKIEGLMTNG